MLLFMRTTDHLPTFFIMDCMNVYPPGFRFYPTDEELITNYLKKKISVTSNPFDSMIAEVDLYKFDPWQLPEKAYFGDKEWFFFSPRDRKYRNGDRPNRSAVSGYWKATGTDKPILSRYSQCIGVKKALVFYEGRAPTGNKTSWMMYEYRLIDKDNHRPLMHKGSMRLDDWVLCRIRQKAGIQSPKPEGNIKKKAKRACDTFEVLMKDVVPDNISFLQPNEWQPQHYDQANDQAMMHDFQEKSSSSHSISYDNFDCQMNENESINESLEFLGEVAPNQPNKKACYVDSSASLNNISDIIYELQSECSTY